MPLFVIPAQAGIQWRYRSIFAKSSSAALKTFALRFATIIAISPLDSGLRRNDGEGRCDVAPAFRPAPG